MLTLTSRVTHARFRRFINVGQEDSSSSMKHMLSKTKIALALGVMALFLTATSFARKGPQDFVLHNQTDVESNSLYVPPHDADDWEEDSLGEDTLPQRKSVKITYDERNKHVHWDLKV